MATHKLWSWMAAIVTLLGFAGTASAQHFQPFIDPDYFDPDLQFFAPAEIDYYGDPPSPNTGWFFTYDRMYFVVSRPDNAFRPWDMDNAWGNRFDIGYMTDETGGWLFNLTRTESTQGSYASTLNSVEFNKVFRWNPTHHNCIIEPFIGVRYVQFNDYGSDENPFFIRGDVRNDFVAGQIGVRAWKNIGHWKLSADIKSFNGVNFQYFDTDDTTEFVPAAEFRTEAQYNLTRDVAIRVGWEMLYFGDGIARNNNVEFNSEDMLQYGVTFGFTVNR